jgi:hypothetical protein
MCLHICFWKTMLMKFYYKVFNFLFHWLHFAKHFHFQSLQYFQFHNKVKFHIFQIHFLQHEHIITQNHDAFINFHKKKTWKLWNEIKTNSISWKFKVKSICTNFKKLIISIAIKMIHKQIMGNSHSQDTFTT